MLTGRQTDCFVTWLTFLTPIGHVLGFSSTGEGEIDDTSVFTSTSVNTLNFVFTLYFFLRKMLHNLEQCAVFTITGSPFPDQESP